MRGHPGAGDRRVHQPATHPRGLWSTARGLLRGRRLRLRRQGGDGVRCEAAARPARPAGPRRDPYHAVHARRRAAAPRRALGASRDRGTGRLHRVDGAWQAPAPAPRGHPRGQRAARGRTRDVVITHPEKIMFPDDGITKGELAAYYETVAPAMLPHVIGRPVTMERFHRGIAAPGFFQKNVAQGPPWLERVAAPKKDGVVHHPIVRDARALVWLANQNCITPHVWTSRAPHLTSPDICVFDLHPHPAGDEPARLRSAALRLRDFLEELGLRSWVKTSGSKGFHIAVPLDGATEYGVVARFAHTVGTHLVARDPGNLNQEFYKADRGGRILVDTGRNEYSATFAAVYAVRPKRGAPVSAPCTWEEVEQGSAQPAGWTLRTLPARLAAVGDLWAELNGTRQSLREAIAAIGRGAGKNLPGN